MLIKKILRELPVTPFPKGKFKKKYDFFAAAEVHDADKCGEILALDIYDSGKKLRCRFFTDKQKYICYEPEDDEWMRVRIHTVLGSVWYAYFDVFSSKESDKKVNDFFGETHRYPYDAYHRCLEFQEDFDRERRAAAADRAEQLKQERIKWFKDADSEMDEYVTRVLPKYVFVSNSAKGICAARCTVCGGRFELRTSEYKHKQPGKCPLCGEDIVYFKERYKNSIRDKMKLCDVRLYEDRMLVRWSEVMRTYNIDNEKIEYKPFFWAISRPKEYLNFQWSYRLITQYSQEWISKAKYIYDRGDAYLYYKDLTKALGVPEHIERIFKDKPSVFDIIILAANSGRYQQLEYLLKLGLTRLASHIADLPPDARSFSEITGVTKQYLPMYKKFNVSWGENRVIRSLDFYVKERDIENIQKYDIQYDDYQRIRALVDGKFSDRKLLNYTYKYCSEHKTNFYCFKITYEDYLHMMKELNMTLETRSEYFPRDLAFEHDRLAERIKHVHDEKKKESFEKAIPKLYEKLPEEYHNKDYCIVLPHEPEDFIREGEKLRICVGMGTYLEKHMTGQSLICFIRHTNDPDTPYVCCEISMTTYRVLQVHGYLNDAERRLPKPVKEFAKRYAAAIQQVRS